jgi:pilus assembly protein CpaB
MTTMRRLLAAVAALLLAAFGALVLVRYVQGADERAQAGEELVPVLVVEEPVGPGTPAAAIDGATSLVEVPARLVAPGGVADLSALDGLVTTGQLLPGGQLLAAHFVDPGTLLPEGTVATPAGHVEVSVTLDYQRAVGGVLTAGNKVGVFVTTGATDAAGVAKPVSTQVLSGITVTRVAGGLASTDSDGAVEASVTTPTTTVTLAVPPPLLGSVVAGMEQGTIWLTLESGTSPAETTSTSISTTPGGQK